MQERRKSYDDASKFTKKFFGQDKLSQHSQEQDKEQTISNSDDSRQVLKIDSHITTKKKIGRKAFKERKLLKPRWESELLRSRDEQERIDDRINQVIRNAKSYDTLQCKDQNEERDENIQRIKRQLQQKKRSLTFKNTACLDLEQQMSKNSAAAKQLVKDRRKSTFQLKERPEADQEFDIRNSLISKALNYKIDDQFILDKKMEPQTWIEDNRLKKFDSDMINAGFYQQIQDNFERRQNTLKKEASAESSIFENSPANNSISIMVVDAAKNSSSRPDLRLKRKNLRLGSFASGEDVKLLKQITGELPGSRRGTPVAARNYTQTSELVTETEEIEE